MGAGTTVQNRDIAVVRAGSVTGLIRAPGSKSIMQRATAAALLAGGTSTLLHPTFAGDCNSALSIAASLGAELEQDQRSVRIRGIDATCGALRSGVQALDCGESGLALRMFTPIAALWSHPIVLTARGTLRTRPVGMLSAPLSMLGVVVSTTGESAPITVCGPLKGGRVHIDGSTSSQALTGLLMALPVCQNDSELFVSRLRSVPYIRLTLELLELFGIRVQTNDRLGQFLIPGLQSYRAVELEIEGDWSAAAFLLVAGALAGEVKVTGLNPQTRQADRAILDALVSANAKLEVAENFVSCAHSSLRSFSFDATDCPDLFPPLVALASGISGVSTIYGAGRLRHKESDRAEALQREFQVLGCGIEVDGDVMLVRGGRVIGGAVSSHDDHRIAMACAVAGLRAEGEVAIERPHCVAKSYPHFFEDLAALQGRG